MNQSNSNKVAALALVCRGVRIFACDTEKKPRLKGWQEPPVQSAFQIGVMWDIEPSMLPAIPCGINGLLVIDCDRRPGKPDGVQAFGDLCNMHGIDQTQFFAVTTPSGGAHLYFKTVAPYGNSSGSLPEGIDVRGIGGYVIAPGATLPDNRAYQHVQGSWDAIPQLPAALAALLTAKETESPLLPIANRPAATERERQYAENALADEVAKLSATRKGRNAALNSAALPMGEMISAGWIARETAEQALWEAVAQNGYRAKDGDNTAWKTLQSGLEDGILKPRTPLPVMHIEQSWFDAAKKWIEAYKANQAIQSNKKQPVTLLPFSRVLPKSIEWLWHGYLPKAKLILLAAIGGVGKSTISCNWASIVSTGGNWPDGTQCETPGNVLIWSSEDDPHDTIAPRLIAAGADLTRCHFIQGPKDEKGIGRSFDPATDMNELRTAVAQLNGVSLFIIDPLINAVTGDMNKANDVRRGLQSIVDFASEMNCAVLGISHFGKNTQGKQSAERILGSAAFKDYSRTALVAVQDEETGECALARAKTNIAANMGGFAYRIEPGTIQDIETIRIVWGEALEGSARSILGRFENEDKDEGEKLKQAKRFLVESLAHGPVASKELSEQAHEGYGISTATLRKAKESLGITASKASQFGTVQWMCALPLANLSQ